MSSAWYAVSSVVSSSRWRTIAGWGWWGKSARSRPSKSHGFARCRRGTCRSRICKVVGRKREAELRYARLVEAAYYRRWKSPNSKVSGWYVARPPARYAPFSKEDRGLSSDECISLMAKGNHWVHSRRSPRRDIARHGSHTEQSDRGDRERARIVWPHAEKKAG
jgi:hypothetical protein